MKSKKDVLNEIRDIVKEQNKNKNEMKIYGFEKLVVWQDARQLCLLLYKNTNLLLNAEGKPVTPLN